MIFVEKYYKDDDEILCILLVQNVSDSLPVSNIIAKQKNTNNGRHCSLNLMEDFLTESHDQTKVQCAEKKISEATYSGKKSN